MWFKQGVLLKEGRGKGCGGGAGKKKKESSIKNWVLIGRQKKNLD